jgi:hypothetical protein
MDPGYHHDSIKYIEKIKRNQKVSAFILEYFSHYKILMMALTVKQKY